MFLHFPFCHILFFFFFFNDQTLKFIIRLSVFFISNRTWCTVQTSPISPWFRHCWTHCTMTSSCWWTLRMALSNTQHQPVWSCGCAIPTTPVVRGSSFIFTIFQSHFLFVHVPVCAVFEIFPLKSDCAFEILKAFETHSPSDTDLIYTCCWDWSQAILSQVSGAVLKRSANEAQNVFAHKT